jgi:hypothetical protein
MSHRSSRTSADSPKSSDQSRVTRLGVARHPAPRPTSRKIVRWRTTRTICTRKQSTVVSIRQRIAARCRCRSIRTPRLRFLPPRRGLRALRERRRDRFTRGWVIRRCRQTRGSRRSLRRSDAGDGTRDGGGGGSYGVNTSTRPRATNVAARRRSSVSSVASFASATATRYASVTCWCPSSRRNVLSTLPSLGSSSK